MKKIFLMAILSIAFLFKQNGSTFDCNLSKNSTICVVDGGDSFVIEKDNKTFLKKYLRLTNSEADEIINLIGEEENDKIEKNYRRF